MQKTVAFHTLGCKLNFSESSTICRAFEEQGYERKKSTEPADVYVINTCSVTVNADKECRSIVRSLLTLNPAAFVAIIGCYAQLKPSEIAEIPGVDLILGAREKFNLPGYISELRKNERALIHNCEISETRDFISAHSTDRTRSFLKVQDGCDYSCTFCTIPLARGASRSDTISGVVAKAHELHAKGIREIVLTGVNLGDFGFGNADPLTRRRRSETFTELALQLDNTPVARYRISSIEPNLLTPEVISLVARSQRFARHFHIPLQSGNNEILKAMKRRYRRELYADRVSEIRASIPGCSIGVDVITGFPGESDAHFEDTFQFLQQLDVSYLHVFTYSERANTEAATMSDHVPVEVRKARTTRLRALSDKKQRHFYQTQLGSMQEVLFESAVRDGFMHGFTSNYVKVRVPFDPSLVNTLQHVQLEALEADGSVSGKLAIDEGTMAGLPVNQRGL